TGVQAPPPRPDSGTSERLSWRRWMRTIYGSRGRSRFKLPFLKASLALLGCAAWLVYSPMGRLPIQTARALYGACGRAPPYYLAPRPHALSATFLTCPATSG